MVRKFILLLPFILSLSILSTVQGESIQKNNYDPAKHATFLDQHFNQAQNTVRQLEAKQIDQKTAVTRIGALLGNCRITQDLLNKHLREAPKNSSSKSTSPSALKLMLAHNLLESYLLAEALVLNGDQVGKSLAHSLASNFQKILASIRR